MLLVKSNLSLIPWGALERAWHQKRVSAFVPPCTLDIDLRLHPGVTSQPFASEEGPCELRTTFQRKVQL